MGWSGVLSKPIREGTLGHAPHAPYDRVLVHAPIADIPAAWLRQTVPNGRVIAPWRIDYSPHPEGLHLRVTDHTLAHGRLYPREELTRLRGRRSPTGRYAVPLPAGWIDGARASTTDLDITDVVQGAPEVDDISREYVIGLLVRDCHAFVVPGRAADSTLWLHGADTGRGRSIAAAAFAPGRRPDIRQTGPRDLWDEVEAAHRWWVAEDEPSHFDFTMTATLDPNDTVGIAWTYRAPILREAIDLLPPSDEGEPTNLPLV